MQNKEVLLEIDDDQTFVEGIDFYYENGLMVLTHNYLLNRGYCCSSNCRHCPYNNFDIPQNSSQ
jgi:hypothetical protein